MNDQRNADTFPSGVRTVRLPVPASTNLLAASRSLPVVSLNPPTLRPHPSSRSTVRARARCLLSRVSSHVTLLHLPSIANTHQHPLPSASSATSLPRAPGTVRLPLACSLALVASAWRPRALADSAALRAQVASWARLLRASSLSAVVSVAIRARNLLTTRTTGTTRSWKAGRSDLEARCSATGKRWTFPGSLLNLVLLLESHDLPRHPAPY